MNGVKPQESVAYERHGRGEPLVLIHGLGATRRVWNPQIEALAAEREVIAVDMPGFGASPRMTEPPTPAAIAAELTALCGALGIERPHVAGNSLGGWVALEMAKAGNAASACLISPAGLWREPLGERNVDPRRLARRMRPLILALARRAGPRHRMLSSVVAQPENVPADDGVGLISDWITAPGYEAANRQMRNHVFEAPERVEVPVTIAWGQHDRLVAPPRPERRPPGSGFVVLPDCGHTPNWDEPDLLSELMLEASSTSKALPAAA